MKFVHETTQAVVLMVCEHHRESILARLDACDQGNWFVLPSVAALRAGYWSGVSSAHAAKGTAIFGFIEAAALTSLFESINVANSDGSLCPECAAYEWNITPSHIAATATDPVCGRSVPVAEAASHEHEGRLFFFHDVGCRDRFVAAPGEYTGPRVVRAG